MDRKSEVIKATKMYYQTLDGEWHSSKEKAEHHAKLLELRKWYEDNTLFGNCAGCSIPFDDMVGWLQEHPEEACIMAGIK